MKRLTVKRKNGKYDRNNKFVHYSHIYLRLGRLEDIEDELGVSLVTLFNGLKHGIYYRDNNGVIRFVNKLRLNYMNATLLIDRHTYRYTIDYGVTWALTKEELETLVAIIDKLTTETELL